MFLRLPEPELRELISAFLRCLKENINKGVVMFNGLRFHDLEMLRKSFFGILWAITIRMFFTETKMLLAAKDLFTHNYMAKLSN